MANRLLSEMLSHAEPSQVAGLARFFKTGPGQYGFGDKFLGIKVPVTRAVVRACWKEVSFDELEECICCEYHEVRLAALLTLVEIFKHAKRHSTACSWNPSPGGGVFQTAAGIYFSSGIPKNQIPSADPPPAVIRQQCIDFYLSHTPYINNWDLVDLSCYPLLGEWLLDSPDRSLLYNLARNGKTIWEQRIGIVTTMTFIRHGQLDDTFAIADILLHHPHDLIHKAVGWLLREAGKRDKAALEAWLHGPDPSFIPSAVSVIPSAVSVIPSAAKESLPRYQTMPRTALRYAIEKFPEPERLQYLAK